MGLGMDSQGFFNLKCGCHPILDTFLPCRSCWWLAPFHTRSWGNLKRPVKVVDVPPRLTPTPTLDHTFWHILMEPLKLKGGKFGKDWKGPVLTFFQREIFAFRDSEGCYLFFCCAPLELTYPLPFWYFWVDDLPNFPFGGICLVTFPRGFKTKTGNTQQTPWKVLLGELPIHLSWRKRRERKHPHPEVEYYWAWMNILPQKTNMTGWKIHPKNEDSDVFLYFLLKNCVIFQLHLSFPESTEVGIAASLKSGVQESIPSRSWTASLPLKKVTGDPEGSWIVFQSHQFQGTDKLRGSIYPFFVSPRVCQFLSSSFFLFLLPL